MTTESTKTQEQLLAIEKIENDLLALMCGISINSPLYLTLNEAHVGLIKTRLQLRGVSYA